MIVSAAISLFRATLGPAAVCTAPAAATPEASPAPQPAADGLSLSAEALQARSGEVRLTPGKDTLTVTVRPGDTLWNLASRWGAQGATRAYIEAIRQANGLTGDAIALGQPLRLPYDEASAGLQLLAALAIQKDLQARGPAAPALDLMGTRVAPGPVESYLVTVPRRDGKGLQHFALFDDQSGEAPMRWIVQSLSQQAFEARQRGEF